MAQTTQANEAQESNLLMDGARFFAPKTKAAFEAIYEYVELAREVANDQKNERAAKDLADLRRQTEDAIETGRHLNPIVKEFATVVRTYKIDEECIETLFESLYMDVVNSTFTANEYRKYIQGLGEALGLMALKVLCYKRSVLYQKLIPAGRSFGAAICKINLLLEHGQAHKRRGRMYFPDVTKATFNQARLAQIIVDIEGDFGVVRSAIPSFPSGSKTAATLVYVYYYDLLQQMRHLTPQQIDAGQAKISTFKKYYLLARTYAWPQSALRRSSRY
jgi:phytoene/squalene synthetase